MKRTLQLTLFGCTFLVSAQAQFFTIDWFTTDGGGGVSTGGAFTLSGTVGQPDTGTATGGRFTLTGGFWTGVSAIEPPPRLRIERSGTDVILAWPGALPSYQLEETGNLIEAGISWTPVSQAPASVGSEKQVRLPLTGSGKLFRLRLSNP